MRLDPREARELARHAVELADADQAEAVVSVGTNALTRFANNHVHQNVFEDNAQVSIRAVLGKRIGVAATNRLDEDSLADCARLAVESARHAPADDDFPGLPAPVPVVEADRFRDVTRHLDAVSRAESARSIIAQSASRGLVAAGSVSAADSVLAVANSLGVDAAMPFSQVKATVLSMSGSGGSGWASFAGSDGSALSAVAMGDQAASLAERTANPRSLDPGRYTVVLAPEAVAELLAMLAYTGFSAKSVEEGSSFMSGHLGERIMSEAITIADDALGQDGMGPTFDFEGMPKQPTVLVDRGTIVGPVTDSYWAARTGRPNTGHALPAPNAFGPLTLDLEMSPGDTSLDEMIAGVERGVYVTRFHYVNVEDPVQAVLTGMTRDGTFLIESGRLTAPLKNQRFTQGAVSAFNNVIAVGRERERVGEMLGPALVPALAIEDFEITGQTS